MGIKVRFKHGKSFLSEIIQLEAEGYNTHCTRPSLTILDPLDPATLAVRLNSHRVLTIHHCSRAHTTAHQHRALHARVYVV